MTQDTGIYRVDPPVKATVKIVSYASRLAVTLPKEVQALGWTEGLGFSLSASRDGLLVERGEGETLRLGNRSIFLMLPADTCESLGWEKGDSLTLLAREGVLRFEKSAGLSHAFNNLFDSWVSVQATSGLNKTEAMKELGGRVGKNFIRGGRNTCLYDWKNGRMPPASAINTMIEDVLTAIVRDGVEINQDNISQVVSAVSLPCAEKES